MNARPRSMPRWPLVDQTTPTPPERRKPRRPARRTRGDPTIDRVEVQQQSQRQQDDDDQAPARPDARPEWRQEDIRDTEAGIEQAHEQRAVRCGLGIAPAVLDRDQRHRQRDVQPIVVGDKEGHAQCQDELPAFALSGLRIDRYSLAAKICENDTVCRNRKSSH